MSEYTSKQSTVTVREEYNVHADADLKPTIREPVQMVKSRVVVLHGWVHTEPARRRLPGFDCCEAETGYVANVLRSNFFTGFGASLPPYLSLLYLPYLGHL